MKKVLLLSKSLLAKNPADDNQPKSKPVLFLKARDKHDAHTSDMFGTHVETHVRKDGVVQKYHVAAEKPKVEEPSLHEDHSFDDQFFVRQQPGKGWGLFREHEDEKGPLEEWSGSWYETRDEAEENLEKWKDLERNKKKPKVTPQVASARQLDSIIKIAADSIEQLRKPDVERVLREAPAHFRVALASHIKEKRKDLADEVKDVMDEGF